MKTVTIRGAGGRSSREPHQGGPTSDFLSASSGTLLPQWFSPRMVLPPGDIASGDISGCRTWEEGEMLRASSG